MNLSETELTRRLDDPSLSPSEQALIRCRLARRQMMLSRYDLARESLGELWRGTGARPRTEGLGCVAAAHVLGTSGALTSRLGSFKQVEGAQEKAKDLLTEAARIFKAEGDRPGHDAVMVDLGYCYWRAGASDEARVILREVLERGEEMERELRALAMMYLAIVERMALRLHEALRLHTEGAELFKATANHVILGTHHAEFGLVLRRLGESEMRTDFIDRALIEFSAATYHYEQAGHTVYAACMDNQVAMSLHTLALQGGGAEGILGDALDHLDRAAARVPPSDRAHLSSIRETRAKVFLAQGRAAEAEREARAAVKGFRGDDVSLRAEAMITRGCALCALGRHGEARGVFEQAEREAREAGDVESAGLAALTMIETLSGHLDGEHLALLYEVAAEAFSATRHRGLTERLCRASLVVLRARPKSAADGAGYQVPALAPGFNFFNEVTRYERHWIQQALKLASGRPTAAARLLGLRHQTLTKVLEGRHKDLSAVREPPTPRRRSIISVGARKGRRAGKV